MNFQVRLRHDEFNFCNELLEEYIKDAERVLFFRHAPSNENIHYHIYFINLQRTDEAIRKRCSKFLPKENYSVKKTCGGKKNLPITLDGAYIYATNPKSNSELKYYKGITQDQLEIFELKSKAHYDPPKQIEKVHVDHYYPKPDKTWEMLKEQSEKYVDKSVKQIKSMICAQWLNNGKAIPRPSDLHRYAVSLYYLNKFKDEKGIIDVPEYALEGEFINK